MHFPADSKSVSSAPRIDRVRHELKWRLLTVASVVQLTPGMLRINLSGEDLSDFRSLSPDDHVKIFVPAPPGEPERRDYTPRRYDALSRTLTIDFAVHDAGAATRWALQARPGDRLEVAGPRGSAVVSPDVERWLLIGDETALPATGRRIEEAAAGTRITSVVAVSGPEEHQKFETRAELIALWAHRPLSQAADPEALLAAVKTIGLEPETFVWIAAEAAVTRAIRAHLVEKHCYPLSWTKASRYWVMGHADARETFD